MITLVMPAPRVAAQPGPSRQRRASQADGITISCHARLPAMLMRWSVVAVLVAGMVGAAFVATPAAAHGHPPRVPVAAAARACHNHSGKVEGDGEYTDGAIQSANGISCGRALALVKPRYRWIYTHWNQTYHHGFRIGSFHCRITPDGPDDLKSCTDGRRRFSFI
jgi:hypothetical protein